MLSTAGIYRDTLKNVRGCDSFLTLNLTVKNITSKTIHDTICSNGVRIFNGQNITTSGIFRDTLVNAQGCDSFVILNLFVKPTSTGSLNVSICSNATYFFNGQMLSTAGIYRDTLKNMRGCDSFLTLNLTVKNISFKTIYDTICSNGVRVFNGQNIATSGIFRDTLVNAQGCDSFVILNLFVKPTSTGLLHVSICSNTTYFFKGQMLSTAGIYRDTLKNMRGCDSFLTLNLTVKNITFKTIHDTICSNGVRVFNGQNITTSGIFRDTLVNAQGCDSFIILNLFVKPTSTGSLYVSICSNTTYFFNGQILSTAGIYRDTLKNLQGCDSFLTLNLTVNPQITYYIDTIISKGQLLNSKGRLLDTSGTYIDTLINSYGCDSIVFYSVIVEDTSKSKNENEIETFIIPNYISPNGDFINDFWVLPRNIYKKHPNLKSIIYNRWGNIVWRSTGKYNDDWNGQLQDSQELVPDGVYYYILELEDNMKVTCSGFIQVMR
jgi:gliding motility-associated-like protein